MDGANLQPECYEHLGYPVNLQIEVGTWIWIAKGVDRFSCTFETYASCKNLSYLGLF